MTNNKILPKEFNMSVGLSPIILGTILLYLLKDNSAIYIGTVLGYILSYFSLKLKDKYIPNYILYLSTIVMFFLSIFTFISPRPINPFIIECTTLAFFFIVYIEKRNFLRLSNKILKKIYRKKFYQSAEASVVTIRFALILGVIHLAILEVVIWLIPNNIIMLYLLYNVIPLVFFILVFLINQVALNWFNETNTNLEYIPIVDEQGKVIGRNIKSDKKIYQNKYINPVIRIALYTDKMIYLHERSDDDLYDQGKVDIPLEYYLKYGETLEDGVINLLNQYDINNKILKPEFNIFYHFNTAKANRLVYLFMLNIKNESILRYNDKLYHCKLWSFKQIRQNIGREYFSDFFEEEYEYLRDVIYIKEKYKGS